MSRTQNILEVSQFPSPARKRSAQLIIAMAHRTHAIAESDKSTTQDTGTSGNRRPTTAGNPRGAPMAMSRSWRRSSTGASRRHPFQALSSLLDNLQTALPSLKSSKTSQKRALTIVCMALAVSAGVSCSRRAMRCSLVQSGQSWGLSLSGDHVDDWPNDRRALGVVCPDDI